MVYMKNRRIPTVRYKIHYLMSLLLGLATIGFMGVGTTAFLEEVYSKEHMGHGTPVEFIMAFLLIGLLCFGLFLILDLVSAIVILPKNGRRKRHFLLALLLYISVVLMGWGVIVVL